ncbi:MAG: shikimate kinase [Alphaproteobacteria bacterium]
MTEPPELILPKTLVLVGMMGAGKTAIGRRVAARLGLTFRDADHEIEAAAGCDIPEIFRRHGEAAFREGERRVIARMLDLPVHVLATGGGAFVDPETRALIRGQAISVWLRADFATLWSRVQRRDNRPLLKTENPQETLRRLIDQRYPIYAEADITVDSYAQPRDETARRVIEAVADYIASEKEGRTGS